MAQNTNSSKPIIKLQALIRGYLVRKKFSRLKCDYIHTVKCFEGKNANVAWKNASKLCLPIVRHYDTSEEVHVLTDDVQQENSSENTGLGLETELNLSNHLEVSYNSSNNSRTEVFVSNADFEGTAKLNSSASKDNGCSIDNWATKDNPNLNQGLDDCSDSTYKTTDKTINHIEIAQGNTDSPKTDEQRQPVVNENNCNDSQKADEMLYPSDKTSLIKLREDLAMELLWIDQAIESRISYLTIKEKMNKQENT